MSHPEHCADGAEQPLDEADAAELPSLEALVAGTVALMTAHAAPCSQASLPTAQLRHLLARKVVSNLFFLMQHPHASAALRQSLAKAHATWQTLVREGEPGSTCSARPTGTGQHPPAQHAVATQRQGPDRDDTRQQAKPAWPDGPGWLH